MVKILLVEDDPLSRDMLTRRLRRKGFEVVTADDGAAGVKIAHDEQPDLVLMDLKLPILDGWEATRRIKRSETTKDIPVVALTAFDLESHRDRAARAGCDAFETKPVQLTRLIATIRSLLPVSGGAA